MVWWSALIVAGIWMVRLRWSFSINSVPVVCQRDSMLAEESLTFVLSVEGLQLDRRPSYVEKCRIYPWQIRNLTSSDESEYR
jgi:hypothetical protein